MKSKGKKPRFTAKQVERMRDMKLQGLPVHEIARVMNIGTSSISAYLRGTRAVRVE